VNCVVVQNSKRHLVSAVTAHQLAISDIISKLICFKSYYHLILGWILIPLNHKLISEIGIKVESPVTKVVGRDLSILVVSHLEFVFFIFEKLEISTVS